MNEQPAERLGGAGPHLRTAAGASDAWIVQIAKHGDRGAFVALFSHFAPRVKAYLVRLGMPGGVAEDIAQETLLTVWRKAGRFDPTRASAEAWIYTIARNLRVDALRRERHPDDLASCMAAADEATPEDLLLTLDDEETLQIAIARLPVEQAEVLRLGFFEEMTHPEIAQRLRLPLGTVKSRIRLATAHLRAALGGAA